ncbi:hypothetical protein AQUCO_00500604v1 [Aquilegia coerulea]|uniref:Helitron helicase-like domain-containing protein n=1 Tax=Aquilegia coerulea TaxID=218851 RepID=A0A2G5ET06_AQUCA|nr:hypothetical protein AQUCO_00500604v1 [Aquilegia coerulea]
MYEIYQDSMAITRHNRHPDIFLTATANPNWPEIRNELKPHQTATDRPDLVARVFELKRQAIMKIITEGSHFGKVAGYVYTIEFQKRGLPHMHVLIFLQGIDKIRTPAQVDRFLSATFADPLANAALFSTISRCMVHGPCGSRNPDVSCIVTKNGTLICKARFPRSFVTITQMGKDGYSIYKRPDTGLVYRIRGHEVDNRDVVPHNPYLFVMFDCYINVEVCASVWLLNIFINTSTKAMT